MVYNLDKFWQLCMVREQNTIKIKEKAKSLGFLSCGVAKAEFLEAEAPRLEHWLNNSMHGQMQYMENYFDKRLNPKLLVPNAKSVVSLLYNYYPPKQQRKDSYHLAKYAYGEDYHFVIKQKLKSFLAWIQDEIGEVHGRVFVDSAPVLEKAWAAKSGLGWIGKNSNLLTKQVGSFYFLAELILDLDLLYDSPTTNHCGQCTACIDACPTNAITPYQVDGSKCISYFTIELKEEIPQEYNKQFADWMFGCDICQDVCPWNRFAQPHQEKRFLAKEETLNYGKEDWQELTEEVFKDLFKKSAVKRTKFSGLKRNIEFLRENKD